MLRDAPLGAPQREVFLLDRVPTYSFRARLNPFLSLSKDEAVSLLCRVAAVYDEIGASHEF